jgi:hypothetical protein
MKSFDKRAKGEVFHVGDLVFLWDKRREKSGDHSKFDSLWLGPFSVHASVGPNTFQLADLDGDVMQLHVNGQCLKHFFQ